MKIINFYSFKGGVGRSLALINVAYHLERSGQRVGLVDLDIEACGLNHILLRPPIPEDRDFLSLINPRNRDLSNLEQYVDEISFANEGKPGVFLIPTIADSELLDQISWGLDTQHFLLYDLFPAFGRLYDLDFLLIDSRSGLSDFSTFALKIADAEVLVCRLDNQNRYGISRMVKVCKLAGKIFRVVVSGCPEKGYELHLRNFEKAIDEKVNYLLPYEPRLYYEEFTISMRLPRHKLSRLYASLALDLLKAVKSERT
jgi:MinD-like ATPase involved in chromosome partitioning or flagellar assembly